jgi:hypothetical protein
MPTGPIKWVDAQSQRRSPEWFSFKHGPVHFLHISTEVDFAPGSPQFECVSCLTQIHCWGALLACPSRWPPQSL